MRSGREHWAWMVVVEVRQRTLWIAGRSWTRRTRRTTRRRRRGDEEERRGEEEQATDIKSNNPHLAGGEQTKSKFMQVTEANYVSQQSAVCSIFNCMAA